MTLKEQITKDVLDMPLINSPTKKEISEYEKGIFNLEKIAEDFAIGFAEWYLNLSKSDDWEKFDYNTNEKLLKMYKIEKGL
jgi:hypothetical protein